MRTLWLSLAGAIIPALLGGAGVSVAAAAGACEAMAFPSGTFVSVEHPELALVFEVDGSGRVRSYEKDWEVRFTFATHADLYTEMTFEDPAPEPGPQVPATYHWDFTGEYLFMEVWGEDLRDRRRFLYGANTWRRVEDPREALVAIADTAPGERVGVVRTLTPASQTAAEAYGHDDHDDVDRRVAAVAIPEGQTITPAMLASPPPE